MRLLASALLAGALLASGTALAGGPADVADLVPADAAAVVVIDVTALREVAAVRRVFEGARPGELLPALAPVVGDATGADALPPSTILVASGSLNPDARDLLAAIRLDTPSEPIGAAMRGALERFGSSNPDGTFERSGFVAATLDDRTWVAGTPVRVQAVRGVPGQAAQAELPELSGAVVVAHLAAPAIADSAGAPHIGALSAWLRLEPDVRLRLDIGCALEDLDRVETELRTTLTRALSLPQLVALAPGPLPVPDVSRIDGGVRVELVVPPATWDALVQTAASAVQSEFQ